MQTDPLFFLIVAAVLVVVAILASGLIGFTKGGDFNRKYANKIMRARLIAQAFAVALILLFVYLREQGG